MTRIEANRKIIEAIKSYAETYPELRFHQILQNVNVEDKTGSDKWYEESEDTLSKMCVIS